MNANSTTRESGAAAASPGKEVATLAGGCFWCLEAVYHNMLGVEGVTSGYMGGKSADPTYEAVCSGDTGHAEVVQITFDPKTVSYQDLLEVFFALHDATTLNRQGNDIGTQYRSAIFFHTQQQKLQAEKTVANLTAGKVFSSPIVTQITPASAFYPAEDYHREYYERNSSQPYCRFVVEPKLQKFRRHFAAKMKKS